MAVMFTSITYPMLGLEWTAKKFFWYLYFLFFSYAYFTYYGMMAVGLTPNHQIAAVVASFFYQIWNIYSGYLLTRKVSYYCITPLSEKKKPPSQLWPTSDIELFLK